MNDMTRLPAPRLTQLNRDTMSVTGPKDFSTFRFCVSFFRSLVFYHGCEQLGQDAGPDCECPAGVREDTSTYYFELSV